MPKLDMTIIQYLWCWVVVVFIHLTPEPSALEISGGGHYFYVGSISLIAIYLLIKWSGKNYLALGLCSFEFLAILLQLFSWWANFTKEVNWFYSNYRVILESLYELQVALLIIAGTYGFGLLVWNIGRRLLANRSDSHRKSLVWPIFYERRKTER